MQHLPVVVHSTAQGESDSDLVNTVFLDNAAMEIYHSLLENPEATVIRLRWYGTGAPERVDIERMRWSADSETARTEISMLPEDKVLNLLRGGVEKVLLRGSLKNKIIHYEDLLDEILKTINSKQLLPTMRTQFMRTSFEIPCDDTVRVALDTNLCMINERTEETMSGLRWYRDPHQKVPLNEITRFPHAVLEVKLQIDEGSKTPEWVTELIESGMLMEVHKFSKFIHGCAVLLPDEVRAVPYWIDDASLINSIVQSGGRRLLEGWTERDDDSRRLPFDNVSGTSKVPRLVYSKDRIDVVRMSANNPCLDNENCRWATQVDLEDSIRGQKSEPKLFFASERNFIMWLHISVMLSSIATALLAFSKEKSGSAAVIALMMLPVSFLLIVYSLRTFFWRNALIRERMAGR